MDKTIPAIRPMADVPANGGKIKFDAEKMMQFDAKTRKAEIFIFAGIGDPWDGITAKAFGDSFAKMGDAAEITVHINSMGGDVFQGTTIYNLLAQHPARKVVNVVGIAASIASIIAMAGDEIRIAKNGFMFIHDAHVTARAMNAALLRKTANELDLVSSQMAMTYADRAKGDAKKMREIMLAETLLSADDAMKLGLVDTITDPVGAQALMTHYDRIQAEYKGRFDPIQQAIDAAKAAEADEKEPAEVADDKSESAQRGQQPSGAQDQTSPTLAELKAKREEIDLAFYMAERSIREAIERDARNGEH